MSTGRIARNPAMLMFLALLALLSVVLAAFSAAGTLDGGDMQIPMAVTVVMTAAGLAGFVGRRRERSMRSAKDRNEVNTNFTASRSLDLVGNVATLNSSALSNGGPRYVSPRSTTDHPVVRLRADSEGSHG